GAIIPKWAGAASNARRATSNSRPTAHTPAFTSFDAPPLQTMNGFPEMEGPSRPPQRRKAKRARASDEGPSQLPPPGSASGASTLRAIAIDQATARACIDEASAIEREATGRIPETSTGVSSLQLERATCEVVRYMLFKWSSSHGAPINKAEVAEVIQKTLGEGIPSRNVTPNAMARAQARLAKVYGLHMKELQKTKARHSGPSQSSGSSAQSVYVLRTLLPRQLRPLVQDEREAALRSLAIVVVGLLRLSGAGNKMAKGALWEHLQGLGLMPNEQHEVFGDWEKLITETLVKRRYIILEHKSKGTDQDEVFMLAENGADAISENDVKDILDALRNQ
ncbi:unnamed protein product, partial [Ostreobium quekettii]